MLRFQLTIKLKIIKFKLTIFNNFNKKEKGITPSQEIQNYKRHAR